MPAFKDLVGLQYGRLVVLGLAPRTVSAKIRWMCRCLCGTQVSVDGSKLRSGNTQSCGCLRAELAGTQTLKHGHGGLRASPTYKSWKNMLIRCRHPDRGYNTSVLKVCRRWLSFENFLADMGERKEGTSLERLKNHKGYSPGNCEWANRTKQSLNRTTALLITYRGKTQNLSSWCKELGLNYQTVYARVVVRKWAVDAAFSVAVRKLNM